MLSTVTMTLAVLLAGILQGVGRPGSVYSIMPTSNGVRVCGSQFPPTVSKHCLHQHSAMPTTTQAMWNTNKSQLLWYSRWCFLSPTSWPPLFRAIENSSVMFLHSCQHTKILISHCLQLNAVWSFPVHLITLHQTVQLST